MCKNKKVSEVNKCFDYSEDWAELSHDEFAAARHRDDDGNGGGLCSSHLLGLVRERMSCLGFEFDFQDVLEKGVSGVLCELGLLDLLDLFSENVLLDSLLLIGGAVQSREMRSLVGIDGGHGLDFVKPLGAREAERFCRVEAAFRKLFFVSLKRGRDSLENGPSRVRTGFLVERADIDVGLSICRGVALT